MGQTRKTAKREAHELVSLLWDHLPTGWLDDLSHNQFELEFWLVAFASIAYEHDLKGFALANATRKRAAKYYRQELALITENPTTCAFIRSRLELALLRTVGADKEAFLAYHGQQTALMSAVHYSGFVYERAYTHPYDPSSETPF